MEERVEIAMIGTELKRYLDEQFDGIKKQYDLKRVDIEVLYYLSECNGKDTPTEIHRILRINRGHVSQAIDTLLGKGYICALPDASDKRVVHYKVNVAAENAMDEDGESKNAPDTTKAMLEVTEVLKQIKELKQNIAKSLFEGVSEEEKLLYKQITCKIFHNLDHMLKR